MDAEPVAGRGEILPRAISSRSRRRHRGFADDRSARPTRLAGRGNGSRRRRQRIAWRWQWTQRRRIARDRRHAQRSIGSARPSRRRFNSPSCGRADRGRPSSAGRWHGQRRRIGWWRWKRQWRWHWRWRRPRRVCRNRRSAAPRGIARRRRRRQRTGGLGGGNGARRRDFGGKCGIWRRWFPRTPRGRGIDRPGPAGADRSALVGSSLVRNRVAPVAEETGAGNPTGGSPARRSCSGRSPGVVGSHDSIGRKSAGSARQRRPGRGAKLAQRPS